MQAIASYTAVCYRCSYVMESGPASNCPVCSFPFIFESAGKAGVAPLLERIFDRSSVHVGAPPLPGVDAGPRKAQLLIEARKRRANQQRRATEEAIVRADVVRARIRLGFVGMSAVVAGALAALLVSVV